MEKFIKIWGEECLKWKSSWKYGVKNAWNGKVHENMGGIMPEMEKFMKIMIREQVSDFKFLIFCLRP